MATAIIVIPEAAVPTQTPIIIAVNQLLLLLLITLPFISMHLVDQES
jgi:hypothetical protein